MRKFTKPVEVDLGQRRVGDPGQSRVQRRAAFLLELVNLFFLNAGLDGRLEQNLNYWVNTLDWKKDH